MKNKQLLELLRKLFFAAQTKGLIQKLDENGLTFIQRGVLLTLQEQGQMSMTGICRTLAVSKPAMTRITDNMEKKHFIERTRVEGDRRTHMIVMTATGKDMLKKIDKTPLKVADKLLSEATAAEKERYLSTLTAIVQRLENL